MRANRPYFNRRLTRGIPSGSCRIAESALTGVTCSKPTRQVVGSGIDTGFIRPSTEEASDCPDVIPVALALASVFGFYGCASALGLIWVSSRLPPWCRLRSA